MRFKCLLLIIMWCEYEVDYIVKLKNIIAYSLLF